MDPLILGQTPDSWRFEIIAGDDWIVSLPHRDDDTGAPAQFISSPDGPWSAKLDITTDSGALIARLSSSGIADGTLILGDDGLITTHLAATFTATMAPTVSFDPSYGWHTNAVLKGALRITGTHEGSPWTRTTYLGTGRIIPQEVAS